MIKHKNFGMCIKVNSKNKKDKDKADRTMELLNEKLKEEKECLAHVFSYVLSHDKYRAYRRGKNRCLRCGFKIGTPDDGKEG